MIQPGQLDDLIARIEALLPPGAKTARGELERNLRALLQQQLQRLDVVPREQFEVQSALLRRSRERLEALEKRVAALESGNG